MLKFFDKTFFKFLCGFVGVIAASVLALAITALIK